MAPRAGRSADNQSLVRVIIVGCGRVGSRLALQMVGEGHEVTIIDTTPNSFTRLGNDFPGNPMIGDGTDEEMLRRAGIEAADALIAVTPGDNRNIMAAQIAQHVFNVKHVICRLYDPIRDEVYRQLGLRTFCPTVWGADTVRAMIKGG